MKVKTRITMLKVKIKSLAEEARIIRLEEHRACGRRVAPGEVKGRDDWKRTELYFHRVKDVRAEQRHSLLAYAFLRGRSYASCEGVRTRQWWEEPNLERVAELVRKFGPVNPSVTKAEVVVLLNNWHKAVVV